MDINSLRQYRIILEPPFFNAKGHGIALFDLSLTFIIAYLLEPYIIPRLNISKLQYYLFLLPLGVIVHVLTKQDTFLNKQLFNDSINIYKIIMIIIVYQLWINHKQLV